jgi:hypothetical protein
MARAAAQKPHVTDDAIAACLAKAVAEGDIVNFRYMFSANAPLRDASPELLDSEKYAYLRLDGAEPPRYAEARALVRAPETWAQIRKQLEKKGPPQLPAKPLLELADNAVRLEKYHAAAQAYELLRVRRRMQELYFEQGDAALDAGEVERAVRAYVIATGLDYDYAAFPEPMPTAPNYQSRALMLHAVYPQRPEQAVALQPPQTHLRIALEYLLLPEAAGRLSERPFEQGLEFLEVLVRQRDPRWDEFRARFRAACELATACADRLARDASQQQAASLADELADMQQEHRPAEIPAALLGREIDKGEWWQYVKELAYEHPPAVLFVSRQRISKDTEILMPRYVGGSQLVQRLGLEHAKQE